MRIAFCNVRGGAVADPHIFFTEFPLCFPGKKTTARLRPGGRGRVFPHRKLFKHARGKLGMRDEMLSVKGKYKFKNKYL